MTKLSKNDPKPNLPKLKVSDPKAFKFALGSENTKVQHARIDEIIGVLNLPDTKTLEANQIKILAALETFSGIAPKDDLERMLATQIIATHSAAMECMQRAMLEGQSFEGRDSNLKHAEKLMGVYTKQLEALNKHRGKGQQKITVKHVNVAAGGQAIVGNVDTQSRVGGSVDKAAALDTPREAPIDVTPGRQPAKIKARK